jgi:hypothetical protein
MDGILVVVVQKRFDQMQCSDIDWLRRARNMYDSLMAQRSSAKQQIPVACSYGILTMG